MLGAFQFIDRAIHQRTDEFSFPALHRRTGERKLVQPAVYRVFGFLHLEDGRTLKWPYNIFVAPCTEGDVVGEDRLHRVEGIGAKRRLAVPRVADHAHLRPPGVHRTLDAQFA